MVFYFLKDQWEYGWFYGVFVLGMIIPPLLPTVVVVSVGILSKRLQQKKMTYTYLEGILIAGKVNAAFFGKTGTLTKQGMNFLGCVSSELGYADMDRVIRLHLP
jgi:cation-transporting ATPase 13A3/4/5